MAVSTRVVGMVLYLITIQTSFAQNYTESSIKLYEKGVAFYLEDNFLECSKYLEASLAKYHDYLNKLSMCRISCKKEAEISEPLYPVDIDNLLFYENTVKSTLCIIKCKRQNRGTFAKFNIDKEAEKVFQMRKPYEYLHICAFQNKEYQKAASAAFTYIVKHPNDKIMTANLKYYSSLDGVNITKIVNYEAKEYVTAYIDGADAYTKKNWKRVVDDMEESLSSYLQSDEECRVQCEGPFDQGWLPDFIPAIANHFTYCLRCKQKCKEELNSLNGEIYEDLLPSHYHYLQYAYFKQGNIRAASAAVASYLLFYPNDATMLENKNFYSDLPKAKDDYFLPRPEAVHYVQRDMYEKRLLKFILKEFQFKDMMQLDSSKEVNNMFICNVNEFNGWHRFVSDGLMNKEQCQNLIDLAKMFAILGDGYHGNKSPHTNLEIFQGITVKRIITLVKVGLLEKAYLGLYLKVTDEAKIKVQKYFHLSNLYFTYTHLVCRTALPDFVKNRSGFSHPIHADNCNVLGDGFCEKAPPAYIWRDYSAIIYLNEDFDGGEFIFTADSQGHIIQNVIKPKCGRMVAFSSGCENLHGVKAVVSGSRCAIAVWFTLDPKYDETDRISAYDFT